MKKHYLLVLLILALLKSQAQYTWLNKDTFPGLARAAAAGFSINGAGYIVGGIEEASNAALSEVWSYNPVSDSWIQKNSYPNNADGAALMSIGDSIYVCGGALGTGTNSSATYLYNPATDSWAAKANFPENGVSGAFHFAINGIGFVGTGERNGSNTSTSVYSYNPTTDSWNSAAAYPGNGVVCAAGFAIDSLGYAGLGTDGNNNFFNSFYKYSPSSNTWTAIARFPGEPRSCPLVFVLNGKAYVGGGLTSVPGNSSVDYELGDFFEYDPSTDTWAWVPGLPTRGKHYASTFAINGSGYVVCGQDNYIGADVTTVSEFGTCSEITGITPLPGGNSKSGIEIYPNPSTNDVNVKISGEVNSAVKYEVVSVDGKLIKSGTTQQNTFRFSADNLSDGIYILTLTDNEGIHGEQRFEVIH
jgi:N-acetylneuraminic acid mutarotase